MMHIRSATFQISAPSLALCPASKLPEFAFIGRSNVGKSSLLNLLVGRRELAKVSATPGHTQLINFFAINQAWTLVDLPGYGYSKTNRGEPEKFQRMIGEYLAGRGNLTWIFVLLDARHEPQKIDLEFLQWVLENRAPFALVFTKTDLVKAEVLAGNIALFEEAIAGWGAELPYVFASSSKTKAGRGELLEFIERTVG